MVAPVLGGLCEPCVLEEFKVIGSETEPFCETPKESSEGRWGSGLCYQASKHEAADLPKLCVSGDTKYTDSVFKVLNT